MEDQIVIAIDNDDYVKLRQLAKNTEDPAEASELRAYAAQAYNRAWAYDEQQGN